MKKPLTIKSITVKRLFGYYTYDLNLSPDVNQNLIILYGDNGSGKTTILKLIYYLLSTTDRSGHKSRIGETKFKSLQVLLSNGIEISASRRTKIIGSFTYKIKKRNRVLYSLLLKAELDNSINLDENSKENKKYLEILKFIRALDVSIHLLTDKRESINFITNKDDRTDIGYISNVYDVNKSMYFSTIEKEFLKKKKKKTEASLTESIRKLEKWIGEKSIKSNKIGERNTNTIYTEIIKSISTSRKSKKMSLSDERERLITKINEIIERSIEYSKYGLISIYEVNDIRDILYKAKGEKLSIIYNVIQPYIEGIEARLNALKELQNVINTFIESVNSYYSNKCIYFHLESGFNIKYKSDEEPISFEKLSSGEKQLLLLIINTITAGNDTSIFIIDEPEISLNIKWQRKLLKTLMNLNKTGHVQFIIATHSLEIITPNRNNVVKLINKEG